MAITKMIPQSLRNDLFFFYYYCLLLFIFVINLLINKQSR